MLGVRRVVYQISRWTSLGPPLSPPPTPGSFSHKYDTFMSNYPKIHALHHRVVNGSRWCVMDVKQLWALRSVDIKKESEVNKLSIAQLETLVQSTRSRQNSISHRSSQHSRSRRYSHTPSVPCEIPKVATTIVLLPLPLTIYVIGFAIIFFPKLVLSRHFWTREQREEFFLSDIKKSVESARPLTQSKLPSTIEELSGTHKRQLSSLFGGILPWSTTKLMKRYILTRNMDSRLEVSALTRDQLLFHLYLRRVPYVLNEDEDSLRNRLTDVIGKGLSASSPVEYLTSTFRSQ